MRYVALEETRSLLSRLLILVICALSICLFRDFFPIYRKCLYVLTLLIVLLGYKDFFSLHSFKETNSFLFPFAPWLISTLVLFFFHGVSGNSPFLHLLLLSILIFSTTYNLRISRDWVMLAFATNTLVISILVILWILKNGLDTLILGVNKNLLMPEITLLSSLVLIFLAENIKKLTFRIRSFLLLSILVTVTAVIMAEVRTSILILISSLPVIYIAVSPDLRKKCLFAMFGFISIVICSFFITGRLQQGYIDILNYLNGYTNSSWGIRLELWKLSISAFAEHPFVGWGNDSFQEIIRAGYYFSVPTFDAVTFHSDFFNILSNSGLMGLVGWLATVMLLYKQSTKDHSQLMLCTASVAVGLTSRFWSENISAMYIFMLCWILLRLSNHEHNRARVCHFQVASTSVRSN